MPVAILQATGLTITIDTRANILASTPTGNALGFATDTNEFFVYNTGWYVAPLELKADNGTPDIGLQWPMVNNDKSGYTAKWITNKSIFNSRILGSSIEEEGSIRTVDGELQVYLNGTWETAVTGFRFRQDDDWLYHLEWLPTGFTKWIDVATGDSTDDLGLNGLPLVQNYIADIGPYPTPIRLQGRSFD